MKNSVFSIQEFITTFRVGRNFFSQSKGLREIQIIRDDGKRTVVKVSSEFTALLNNYNAVRTTRKQAHKFNATLQISKKVLIGFWK